MVYGDLEKNPLIVPLKSFRAHEVFDSLGKPANSGYFRTYLLTLSIGALHCEFHPTQPWVFSCGKNGDSYQIRLFS
jgi:ribosome biogenesis protein ERB1